jgi:hypothetical protein
VYIVETSAPPPFEPYWFADQLEIVDPDGVAAGAPAG